MIWPLMPTFAEATIPPPPVAPERTDRAEVFVFCLLVLLGAVLIRPWIDSGLAYEVREIPGTNETEVTYVRSFVRDAITPWLLPALGLTWVLNRRSADLSVFVAFACGSAAAAKVVIGGGHPGWAFAATLAVGLAFGLAHAAAAAPKRLPPWTATVATVITAMIGYWVLTAATGGEVLTMRPEDVVRWAGTERPMYVAGGLFCAAVMLGLLISHADPGQSRPKAALVAAMLASGMLASLGGLCWLMRYGRTPLPTAMVGDLRVVAAAALSGAIFVRGPGRGLLAAAMLPATILLAAMWRQLVLPSLAFPFAWNLLVLSAMVVGAHWSFRAAMRSGRGRDIVWPALAGLGILTLAATARGTTGTLPTVRIGIALALWLAGVVGAGVLARRARTPERHS